MRRVVGLVVLALAAQVAATAHAQAPSLPLGFEPNRGQLDSRASFAGRTPDGAAFLTRSGAVLRLGRGERVALRPRGARRDARVSAAGRMPGVVNRIHGDDPSGWRTGLPMYRRVRQHGIYPGIDLAFHFRRGALEYDWILAPGARARTIDLRVDGGRGLRLSPRGDLLVRTREGVLRQRRPIAYQRAGGRRRAVPVRFVLRGERRIGFAVGRYDRRRPLVIDPVVTFSTYLGGSAGDGIRDVATDPQGNVYVTGTTTSLDFPTKAAIDDRCGTDVPATCNGASTDPYDDTGTGDVFVAKLDPSGQSLVYATYLGGTGSETAEIAVDGQGRVHLFGDTQSTDFPTTPGVLAPAAQVCGSFSICPGMFVTRLTAAGALDWSTFFGAGRYDSATGLAVDASGAVLLTGQTENIEFPRTLNALGAGAKLQPGGSGDRDVFVSKLSADAKQLVWSGVFGGSRSEWAGDVAVASNGDAVVVGETDSDVIYTTDGALQTRCDGPGRPPDDAGCLTDAYVGRVKADGSAFVYATRLGGHGYDRAEAVALDGSDRPVIAGYTGALDFPKGAPLAAGRTHGGFVSRLSATGAAVEYSGLLGPYVEPRAVATAADGGAYVAGVTQPARLTPREAVQGEPGSKGCYAAVEWPYCLDAFAARVAPEGALRWATYLGGRSYDGAGGVAAVAGGAVVAGSTQSVDFPIAAPAFDGAIGAGVCRHDGCLGDGFLTRIADDGTPAAPYDALAERRRLHAIRGSVHGEAAGGTVWFDWTAPANRTVAFDTTAGTLSVRRGADAGTVVASGQHAVWRAVRGRSYKIALSGAGVYTLSWDGAPPMNDDFAAAQTISGATGSAGGNTVYAGRETGEPNGGSYDNHGETIWYAWTAPATGVAVFSTAGSDAANQITVWRGRHVDVLESVAWGQPAVFDAIEGVTYRIRVEPDAWRLGDVALRWRFSPRPANDDLAAAAPLSGESGAVEVEPFAATAELGEPMHDGYSGGQSVWWRWTAPADGTYELAVDERGWWAWFGVYTGTAYGDLEPVAGTGGQFDLRFGAEAGRSYLFVVDHGRPLELRWRRVPAEVNDLFKHATPLAPQGGELLVDGRLASREPDEPPGWRTTWYSWTAPASGPVTFDVSTDSHEPDIAVFTGDTLAGLTEVAREPWNGDGLMKLDAVAGTTYRIQLGDADGEYFGWDFGRPANDDFAAATVLSGASGSVGASIANATSETGENSGGIGPASTWFAWTAPAGGTATFTSVASGAGQRHFNVYQGGAVGSLTLVAEANWADGGYQATFTATAGTTYRIRAGAAFSETRELRLSWNQAGRETTPPVVHMRFPLPGSHLSGERYVQAYAFDHTVVAKVEFLAGDVVVGEGYAGEGPSDPYLWWDTTDIPDGPVQLRARATDGSGNVAVSEPVTVVVDNDDPDTSIAGAPVGTTASRSAKLTFSGDEATSRFVCRIDEEPWFDCASTLEIEHLADGPHVVEARAIDLAGNNDPLPARVAWSVEGSETEPGPQPTPTPEPTLTPEPSPEPSPEPTPQPPGRPQATPTPTPDPPDRGSGGSDTAGGGFTLLPPDGGTIVSRSPDGGLRLTAGVSRGRVTAAALRRGLRVRLACSLRCTATARLALSSRDARRVGLRAGTIARAKRRITEGARATVRLRPSRRVLDRLARRKGLRLRLVIDAVAPDGTRVTIRRAVLTA